jgi:GINS complex subunit 1
MTVASSTSTPSTFSSAGRELLLELKRSSNGNKATHLPSYNVKLVRACFQDLHRSVQLLGEEVTAIDTANTNKENDNDDGDTANSKKPSMSSRPSILFHNASIQRHKRCLLAYHANRMEWLKNSASMNNNNTDSSTTNAPETEFTKDYQDLRSAYAAAVFELNILPPTSHMVQVRVLQELGEVVLESGSSVTFSKGSWLYLPRSDVLEFLQAGSLELMDGEEVDF